MDLRQLRALVAVADHESFSAAARALHTVQSNVSTHIARLERELSVLLVDRGSGKLTPDGQAVVARARRIEAELAAIDADIASSDGDVRGTVRLGVIGTTARWLVPPLLRAIHDAHPRVELIVIDATTTSLLPQVASGRLDSAVVNLPIDDPDITTEALFEEDLVVLVRRDHELARHDEVDLVTLGRHPLMLTPRGTALRAAIEHEAARSGVQLQLLVEVEGMSLMASLASQGLGPAILPASAAPGAGADDWRRVRVRGLERRRAGLATYRRSLPSAPARAVRNLLRAVVSDVGPAQPGIYVSP